MNKIYKCFGSMTLWRAKVRVMFGSCSFDIALRLFFTFLSQVKLVKIKIEDARGKDFPPESQKLIYAGKTLRRFKQRINMVQVNLQLRFLIYSLA